MTVIKNGTLVTAEKSFKSDIKIEDGMITEISRNIECAPENIVDAGGKLIFAGFIDAHTHFEMDAGSAFTSDTFKTASRGAILGGTTTIIDFACQDKGNTLNAALELWHKRASGVTSCNYGFHMSITDWNEKTKHEIDDMTKAGITSYKLYMAYDNLRIPDDEIYHILKRVHEDVHGIVVTHCENGDLVNALIKEQKELGNLSPAAIPNSRPPYVEAEAISRYLYIAGLAGTPAGVVHVSSKTGYKECIRARKREQKVYIETCPQYLLFDESVYAQPGFEGAKFACSPPIRKKSDNKVLWKALKNNKIDFISTDHCSFNFKGQKELGLSDFSKIPNGLPSVQFRPSLIYSYGVCKNKITKEQMSKYLCENPAKLYGMYPQKGKLAVGSDADIVIWNPNYRGIITKSKQITNVDYTPFEGLTELGCAEMVFLNGDVVVTDKKLIEENKGKYVNRKESIYF